MSDKALYFWIGSIIYLAIAITMSVIMTVWAAYNTKDATQKDTMMRLGCSLPFLAVFMMWIMWACFYLGQMNPMYVLTYTAPEIEA